MKKNKMMRLASILLVLTLLTTCGISGTFAKYVTTASGNDSARVAYWGWQNAATLDFDLFDGTYTNVATGNNENIIAPGTEKTETFTFKYVDNTNDSITAPEVAYNFEIDFTATGDYDSLDANTNFVWKLTLPSGNEQTFQKVSDLKTAIESLNKTGTEFYEEGKLPTGFDAGDNTITLGWAWTYSTDDAGDETDTAMGNATNLENVDFTIKITATQVD